jgi:hypothetical protein
MDVTEIKKIAAYHRYMSFVDCPPELKPYSGSKTCFLCWSFNSAKNVCSTDGYECPLSNDGIRCEFQGPFQKLQQSISHDYKLLESCAGEIVKLCEKYLKANKK